MVREDVRVVLQMVPDLAALRILQQRLESGQYALTIQLLRGAGVVMVQGDVGRNARFDAERDAHDLGLHVVEARGLGVEREQVRRAQRGDPALEIRPLRDGFVVALDFREGMSRGLAGGGCGA